MKYIVRMIRDGKKMDARSLFDLDSVDVEAGTTKILDGITTSLPSRQIIAIIGPSGSGKSTFIRLLNKLVSPASGTITFKDETLLQRDPRRHRKEVGLVQQEPFLFPGTVRDNLESGPLLWKEPVDDERLEELLKDVSLDKSFLERNADELSQGEKQRVSLARALANDPLVLLLDEPTSALDIISQQEIESTLLRLKERGLSIVLVTHSIEQARRLADHVLLIKDGKIFESLPSGEFFGARNMEEIAGFFKEETTRQ